MQAVNMTEQEMWENEEPVSELGIDVPPWIAQDISPCTVAAIVQGGCASGAYMPAVTYHSALATMGEYGDGVFDYIEGNYSELLESQVPENFRSWAGMACFYVSAAVELWASGAYDELTEEAAS